MNRARTYPFIKPGDLRGKLLAQQNPGIGQPDAAFCVQARGFSLYLRRHVLQSLQWNTLGGGARYALVDQINADIQRLAR